MSTATSTSTTTSTTTLATTSSSSSTPVVPVSSRVRTKDFCYLVKTLFLSPKDKKSAVEWLKLLMSVYMDPSENDDTKWSGENKFSHFRARLYFFGVMSVDGWRYGENLEENVEKSVTFQEFNESMCECAVSGKGAYYKCAVEKAEGHEAVVRVDCYTRLAM